jgi:hypothetical protein
MVLLIAVPALATDVGTGVNVVSGGGEIPVIKAKWETPDDADPTHVTPGTQVEPVIAFDTASTKEVCVYVVVADYEDKGAVAQVVADVFHPDDVAPFCGSLKYGNIPLGKLDWSTSLSVFDAAVAQKIIWYNSPFDQAETRHELEQGMAAVWKACFTVHNCQPAGAYTVTVNALDTDNNFSGPFSNDFDFVPVAGIELDFAAVTYPNTMVSSWGMVAGDTNFGTAAQPTVRNIGNTFTAISIWQDDMMFGKYIDGTYKVEYDFRLGLQANNDDTTHLYFQPYQEGVVTPNFLELCEVNKLDFSIHIKWADGTGLHNGVMKLGAVEVPFDPCPR